MKNSDNREPSFVWELTCGRVVMNKTPLQSFVIGIVWEKEEVALVEILTYSPKAFKKIFLNPKLVPSNNKFLLSPRNLPLWFWEMHSNITFYTVFKKCLCSRWRNGASEVYETWRKRNPPPLKPKSSPYSLTHENFLCLKWNRFWFSCWTFSSITVALFPRLFIIGSFGKCRTPVI